MSIATPEDCSAPAYYKIISRLSNTRYCEELLDAIDRNIRTTKIPNKKNEDLLLEKSEILRRLGLIDESIETLKTIFTEYGLNARAQNLLESLDSTIIKNTSNHELFNPAPFASFRRCFEENLMHFLLQHIKKNQSHFKPAGIGHNREIDLKKRTTLCLEDLGTFFDVFKARIESDSPVVMKTLGIEAFTPSKIELKITNHLNGHFFNIHKDNGSPGNGNDQRVISFVFYFYTIPKGFSGGDLLLFDTNSMISSYKNYQFTRILCERNSLTYFPSEYFHCVDIVRQEHNEFIKGRFAVTGHIRRATSEAKQ